MVLSLFPQEHKLWLAFSHLHQASIQPYLKLAKVLLVHPALVY